LYTGSICIECTWVGSLVLRSNTAPYSSMTRAAESKTGDRVAAVF
jgi:hypothetical protein